HHGPGRVPQSVYSCPGRHTRVTVSRMRCSPMQVLMVFLMAVWVCAPLNAQPACDANAAVRLVAVDESDIGSRIPLVLIHGIHGVANGRTLCDGAGNYWSSFESYF